MRYPSCILLSIVSTYAIEIVSSDLLTFLYMRANYIIYLSDLSEDYGVLEF